MRSLVAALMILWAGSAAAADCKVVPFDAADMTVCTLRAGQDDLRLFHADAAGKVLGHFFAIDRTLESDGKALSFAMNAGMYHDDRSPVGLYVEEGRQLAPLVTRDGPGNFGLLPNGVFCLDAATAAVIESRRFAKADRACRFATQSGPMLVIDGALHPRFLVDGTSKHIRNGVGVARDGVTMHFVISNARVNFHSFGRFFRDVLNTPNALYFDGKVSRLYAPSVGRADAGFSLGPIVGAVVDRKD